MDSNTLVNIEGENINKTGEIAANYQHGPKLQALLSIRRFSAGLAEHRDQLN